MRTPLSGRHAVLSPAVGTTAMPQAQPRWRTRAVALATALLLGSVAWDAHALALGRVQVLSALGEPLRAEVEVPQVSAEEVESLKASVGSPELFRALGVDYNQVLVGSSVALQRRANGSYFLRVTSDRAINEPFLDVVLEASWATGRIVRDFTLLLDPPNLRPATPLAPQLSSAPTPRSNTAAVPAQPAPAPTASAAAPAPAGVTDSTRRAPGRDGGAASVPAQRAAGAAPASVTVQPGDTAGRLAAQHRPATISLDQMLVALLRANPAAFDGGNINRLRAGSVLALPDAQQAAATSPAEARQIMVAQSRDFNEFRRRMAQGVGDTPQVDGPSRSAAGRVQTEVQDRAPSAATPDRLTLSKSTVQGRGAAMEEERIALARAAQDNAARMAELNKNIAELNRLNAATAAAAGTALGTPAVAPAAPAAAGTAPAATAAATPEAPTTDAASVTPVTPSASAAGTPTSQAAPATTPTASAPGASPAVTAAAAKPAPSSPPSVMSGLIDQVTQNPLVPAAVGGVVALLLGLGFWRLRRRPKSSQVDSSFLESRLQPDSFFGASGGQRIDTAEGQQTSASSMVYSPSQLDAAGDVDPVAEADVYLAYGRDLQAEEILKEALRSTPQRVAIHTKLLEIYARRRDVHAFELIAAEAHALTQGHGPEWQHICHMGQDLDPQNPLYEQRRARGDASGGNRWNPGTGAAAAPVIGTEYVKTDEADASVQLDAASGDNLDLDLDLDLDFIRQHTGGGLGAAIAPTAARGDVAVAEPTPAQPPAAMEGAMLEFDDEPLYGLAAAPIDPALMPALADSVAIELPSLELDPSAAATAEVRNEATAMMTRPLATESLSSLADEPVTSVMLPLDQAMNFDLSELSLDLDAKAVDANDGDSLAPSTPSTDTQAMDEEDPLATKLALAQEFDAIGDSEGARSLAEEVLAEATGELQAHAKRFLADLK